MMPLALNHMNAPTTSAQIMRGLTTGSEQKFATKQPKAITYFAAGGANAFIPPQPLAFTARGGMISTP
jgi:hypothetical protein